MKAVVGIDVMELFEASMNLLGRMEMPNVELELLRVDEASAMSPSEGFAWTAEVLEMQRETDKNVLLDAEELAQRHGMTVVGKNVFIGGPAHELIERADVCHADLIAIGSTRKSKYGSFFFGSVGRALSIGSRHSVLIAKGQVAEKGKLIAVFGTDHSQYADNSLAMLVRMNPKGFEKIILVTALDNDMLEGANPLEKEEFKRTMAQKSAHQVEHLQAAGITAEYKIIEGEFAEVIDHQVTKNKADLLVLGAQGHGFIDRLFIGSSSLQQVVATPHSVLILRP